MKSTAHLEMRGPRAHRMTPSCPRQPGSLQRSLHAPRRNVGVRTAAADAHVRHLNVADIMYKGPMVTCTPDMSIDKGEFPLHLLVVKALQTDPV